MALLRDAAIIHHGPDGRDTVHLLNAPLRGWRPSRRQRIYQFESENGTLTSRAVGDPRWDAEVTVRFDALPTSLIEILALGVTGTLVYLPSLSAGGPGYEMQVLYDGERLGLDPDAGRWAFGEYEVTFRIRRPAGETLEGLIESGPWLFLHTAGAPGLTTTRSTPATYRDRTGIARTAGPGVLRTTWQDGRPYALVEPAGENLIPVEARTFEAGWSTISGSSVAVTQGQTIPGYSPEGAATRIQATGGTSRTRYTAHLGQHSGPYSASIAVHNQGTAEVRMRGPYGVPDAEVAIQPGETRLVRVAESRDAFPLRLDFMAEVGDDIDVIAYAPQVEPGPVATSYIPGETRDRDLVSVDYHHPPGSTAVYEVGIEAGAAMVGNAHAWQIGSGIDPAARTLRLRRQTAPALYILEVGNGSARAWSRVTANPPLGAEYQRLAILQVVGTEARVRLLQRYRETPGSGPWIDASGSWSSWLDVSELLALGWESPHLTLGNVREGTRAGRLMLSALGVLPGADWTLDSATQLPAIRQAIGRGR